MVPWNAIKGREIKKHAVNSVIDIESIVTTVKVLVNDLSFILVNAYVDSSNIIPDMSVMKETILKLVQDKRNLHVPLFLENRFDNLIFSGSVKERLALVTANRANNKGLSPKPTGMLPGSQVTSWPRDTPFLQIDFY